jgi:hypothetical protein
MEYYAKSVLSLVFAMLPLAPALAFSYKLCLIADTLSLSIDLNL